jgi:hypothetical protein
MELEYLKQKITNLIENKKILWTAIIVLTGGIASLIINLDSLIKIILVLIGFIGDYVLINSVIQINQQIDKLLNLPEKEV